MGLGMQTEASMPSCLVPPLPVTMAPARTPAQRPVRLLHLLDALVTPSLDPQRSSGVRQRRLRQRQALAQRLLDPLPPGLAPSLAADVLFWRGLRWGGLGLLLALWLRR